MCNLCECNEVEQMSLGQGQGKVKSLKISSEFQSIIVGFDLFFSFLFFHYFIPNFLDDVGSGIG